MENVGGTKKFSKRLCIVFSVLSEMDDFCVFYLAFCRRDGCQKCPFVVMSMRPGAVMVMWREVE